MFAHLDHCARLRAFGALGMLCDETYLIADGQRCEPAVHNAVAMEMDLLTLGTEDETTILLRQQPRDPPMVGHRM